jgi:hypothetical protein
MAADYYSVVGVEVAALQRTQLAEARSFSDFRLCLSGKLDYLHGS